MVNLLSVHAKGRRFLEGMVQRRAVIADAERLLPPASKGFSKCWCVSAEQAPGGVDSLGQLWLKKGRLPPEQSSRLLIVLTQLRDLNRRHIATEDNEVFPAAAPVFSASVRAGLSEARWRPGVHSGLSLGPIPLPASRSSA